MGSVTPDRVDFIVVGAGPAGAVIASRLARSTKHPTVLLVEAGGKSDSKATRVDAERWLTRMVPGMNWNYQTAPVKDLADRLISYDRGKGLGGSSAINFGVWTLGCRDDYDRIARLVEDDDWSWSKTQQRYRRLESYHGAAEDMPENVKKYHNADLQNHGHDGPINVGFPKIWEPQGRELMDIWLTNGAKHNLDQNSGDPLGLALSISSAYKGVRSTSADALTGSPDNLHVMVDTEVARVLFEGTKAIGISTLSGQTFYADKEVILSCGALDTPRVLMHSGIGPADQLNSFGIPIVKPNDNVGAHLKDHHHIVISVSRPNPQDERTKFYKDKEIQAAARRQWETDGTGPLSEYATALAIAFEKLDHLEQTPEFQSLPKEEQEHLLAPTVPHYEYMINGPWLPHFLDPENAEAGLSVFVYLLNQQSVGSVRLQSADPKQPMVFEANSLSHPFDKRVVVDATKETLRFLNSPYFQEGTVTVDEPRSDSKEDILAYWREDCMSTWHMSATARMGQDEKSAVVDKDLKVFGVDNLRVADMSVVPIIVNNPTQVTAYIVGLTAADKIVQEYGLDN